MLMVAAVATGELADATTRARARLPAGCTSSSSARSSLSRRTAGCCASRRRPRRHLRVREPGRRGAARLALLDEQIGGRELVAGGVIVAGVALIVRGTTRATQPEPAARRLTGEPELGLNSDPLARRRLADRITRTRVVMAAVLLSALAFVGWRKYETHELETRLLARSRARSRGAPCTSTARAQSARRST